jgi:hypothetical protein
MDVSKWEGPNSFAEHTSNWSQTHQLTPYGGGPSYSKHIGFALLSFQTPNILHVGFLSIQPMALKITCHTFSTSWLDL